VGIALILVIMSLALIAWRIRAKARARSVGRRSVSQRGTHRRSSASLPLRGPTPPAPGRRPVKQRAVPGSPVVTPSPAPRTAPPTPVAPIVPSRRSAQRRVPGSSTSLAHPAAMREPHAPQGLARLQINGQAAPSRGRHNAGLHMDGDATWVPAGQLVQVGEYSISGGLIYVGRGLAAVTGGRA
jgi:hypothetical protein